MSVVRSPHLWTEGMETGTAGGRFDGSRQRKQVQVTDEENQLLEAALRTPSLLEKLNAVGCTVGRRVYPVKLGSIGVAALKLLLGTVAFVDPGPTEQLSMQHFQLPHFVPPSPPPVQPAWTTQTVNVVMQIVAYAQHLADRARAAIALSAQAISETESMMMQYEGLIEAAVSPPPPPNTPPPGPRTPPQPSPVSSAPTPPVLSAPAPPPAPPPGAPRLQPPLSCVAHHPRRPHTHLHHARVHLHLHHAPSP